MFVPHTYPELKHAMQDLRTAVKLSEKSTLNDDEKEQFDEVKKRLTRLNGVKMLDVVLSVRKSGLTM